MTNPQATVEIEAAPVVARLHRKEGLGPYIENLDASWEVGAGLFNLHAVKVAEADGTPVTATPGPSTPTAEGIVELFDWLENEAKEHDTDDMPITAGKYRLAASTIAALSAATEALNLTIERCRRDATKAEAALATAKEALEEIATGRDRDGLKVDFPAIIAESAIRSLTGVSSNG